MPAEGEVKSFVAGAREVCVARVDGELLALDNECPHRGGPLGGGVVEGSRIVCPWHGWTFDLRTGQSAMNPAAKIAAYAIKIEGDEVYVELEP
jgi:nitrite reductase/ring-hydroxylating ferredoxin subunit